MFARLVDRLGDACGLHRLQLHRGGRDLLVGHPLERSADTAAGLDAKAHVEKRSLGKGDRSTATERASVFIEAVTGILQLAREKAVGKQRPTPNIQWRERPATTVS